MLVDTAAGHAKKDIVVGLQDTNRAKVEKAAASAAAPASEKPKSKAGRKPKAAKEEVKPVPAAALEPTRIPASFPSKSKPAAKPKKEVAKHESVTDSGTEEEAPAPKAKKVKPASQTVAPSAPASAAPVSEEAPKAKPASSRPAAGSEEAKKRMAELRARRIAKKAAAETADA